MILQSLVKYYEALALQGKIVKPGWDKVRVSYALDLDDEGNVSGVIPLKIPVSDGKKEKMIPQTMTLPHQEKRASNIKANFLCDNATYILGIDNKGKEKRAQECFEASKELHLKLLEGIDVPEARAIIGFYQKWVPEEETAREIVGDFKEEITSGGNLIFMYHGKYVHGDSQIGEVWQNTYDQNGGEEMQCLVTGKKAPVAILHPSIKGVKDAQSSGAALVSFNAKAYESYGHEGEQGRNAPVSEYAAFAYTTALNHLLEDRKHVQIIGNTTVVLWAETAEPEYQDFLMQCLNGGGEDDPNLDLKRLMRAMAKGKAVDWNEARLMPDKKFCILGLAPNAARLSVRFFYQDSYGKLLEHLEQHFERLEIVKPKYEKFEYLPLWLLISETVNKNARDKKASPQMAGDTLRAILTGGRYPTTLYNGAMIRLRAEHNVTRAKAAIIKAYLIRNGGAEKVKGDLRMLNEESTNIAYILGREFALLEEIQNAANPNINATIKDKYFNSACATPSSVFPVLERLMQSHLRKLEKGWKINYEKKFGALKDKIEMNGNPMPLHLSLEDQGIFILGYYHQTQARFRGNSNKEEK